MNFLKNLEMILYKMNLPDYKSLSSCFAHSVSKEINVHESTQPSVDGPLLLWEGRRPTCQCSTCHT